MVSIVQRPIVTVLESSPSNIRSRWVAGWNPIVYKFNFTSIPDASYKVIVYVREFGSNTLLSKFSVRPMQTGEMRVDISSYVRKYLYSEYNPVFETSPQKINCIDEGNTLRFYIQYQEVTNDTEGTIVSDESNYLFVTQSAMQTGDSYNGNMATYVPFGDSLDEELKAKFMTEFDVPVKMRGYDKTINFIFSEELASHEIKLVEVTRDVNGVQLDEFETQLDISTVFRVNHLLIDRVYDDDVAYVDISLLTGQAVSQFYVDEGYVDNGYTEII